MHTKISTQTKRELLHALRLRYQTATKLEKTRILDEYVALSKCHRKHAIRLLTDDSAETLGATELTHGRRIYAEAVREAWSSSWGTTLMSNSERYSAAFATGVR